MYKFTVTTRYYSATDNKLVWVSKNQPCCDEESLIMKLNLQHMKGLQALNLYRTSFDSMGEVSSSMHECLPTMRTNIMVRDESGNLVKWKHLVK